MSLRFGLSISAASADKDHAFISAFWGQSFVAELTRISAHGEKKLKLRRASLAKAESQPKPEAPAGKESDKQEAKDDTKGLDKMDGTS